MLQTSTFNSKITEIECKITTVDNKIPDISGLASKTELTTVDNKIPDISGLASKRELKNIKIKSLILMLLLKRQIMQQK